MILHPLDSLKVRAQTISATSRRTAEVSTRLSLHRWTIYILVSFVSWFAAGLTQGHQVAIYRGGSPFAGIVPSLLGHVPNGLFTCLGYEIWRELLTERAPNLPFRAKVGTTEGAMLCMQTLTPALGVCRILQHTFRRLVSHKLVRATAHDPCRSTHPPQVMLSAVMGDLTGHLWLTPMELLKVQLQTGAQPSLAAAAAAAAGQGPQGFFRG